MTPKKLRKQYLKLLPHLQEAMSLVHDKLSDLPEPDFELDFNFKPFESIGQKVEKDRLKEVAEMSDLVRGRVFFSEQYNFKEVIDLLKHLLGKWIKSIDHKRSKDHGLKYYGVVHLDMNVNGIKFELQVMPVEYKPFKPFLHRIYEKLREPNNKLSDEQKAKLVKTHNKLYEAIHNKAQSDRKR